MYFHRSKHEHLLMMCYELKCLKWQGNPSVLLKLKMKEKKKRPPNLDWNSEHPLKRQGNTSALLKQNKIKINLIYVHCAQDKI